MNDDLFINELMESKGEPCCAVSKAVAAEILNGIRDAGQTPIGSSAGYRRAGGVCVDIHLAGHRFVSLPLIFMPREVAAIRHWVARRATDARQEAAE